MRHHLAGTDAEQAAAGSGAAATPGGLPSRGMPVSPRADTGPFVTLPSACPVAELVTGFTP